MFEVSLRPVDTTDRERLWVWSNDPDVRAQSFSTALISHEEHKRWFDARLLDPFWRAWIGTEAGLQAVGVVRFQIQGLRAEIGVNVAREARGRGVGRLLILQGCIALFETGLITAVDARIKLDNTASVAAFRGAGFWQTGTDFSPPFPCTHWTFSPTGDPASAQPG